MKKILSILSTACCLLPASRGLKLAAYSLQLLAACSLQLAAQEQLPVSSRLTARPQGYWQQQVNYTIDVSLNDTEHALNGFIKIQYTNRSPDTLSFIWFHLWPNAYKNDKTAFSEQLLGNGRTDFYFSGKEQRGYINRLDFRVNNAVAKMEDHPSYIDIIKIILPRPLLPGGQITITTPFHEQLPFNFSRSGHVGGSYQITQWYPKPAVYDQKGWHPMPYLDQGEFYGEYGNFDVRITLPANYIVAATGALQNGPGKQETPPYIPQPPTRRPKIGAHRFPSPPPIQNSKFKIQNNPAPGTKTLRYIQDNIHDFAWFADKRFRVDHDTLQLASGRIIDVYAFYTPEASPVWKNSIEYLKRSVRFHAGLIGEYPFGVISAAEVKMGSPGGMEYPTIAAISPPKTGRSLDLIIEHETGHNWFYSILGTNERRYPWMDEGMNTYYDKRYTTTPVAESSPPRSAKALRKGKQATHHSPDNWLLKKMPEDPDRLAIDVLTKERLDQPIATAAEDFTERNYSLIAYSKAGLWMKQLEDSLGTPLFDSCMQEYFRLWQFKHPYPEDFRSVIENTSHRKLDPLFALLDLRAPLVPFASHKTIRPVFLFSARNTDKVNYINIAPAVGYNKYDQFMIGALIHNFDLPPNNIQFLLAPLYATNSRQLNGIGQASYTWYPGDRFQKIEIGLGGSRFSTLPGIDSNGNKLFGGFYKAVPSLRITLKNNTARSTLERWIEWKTWLIGEKGLNYLLKTSDSSYYPAVGKYVFRYLNQLSFNIEDNRTLYPYRTLLQLQQASAFYRINFTGNYFFNYAKGGGMSLRFFAAKFGYIGNKNPAVDLSVYEPKLTAVRGNEDYTYSNYFFGRNEYSGAASQQIMMRDGGLKIRTDLFQGLQGRSDNWIAAINLNSTLPPHLLPSWVPLKVFLDLGTYADAWQNNPPTKRFLYVGGLQLSLFRNILNFYAPLFYSSDFSDQLKTVRDQNTFLKKLSFSIDIQNINFRKIVSNTPF